MTLLLNKPPAFSSPSVVPETYSETQKTDPTLEPRHRTSTRKIPAGFRCVDPRETEDLRKAFFNKPKVGAKK